MFYEFVSFDELYQAYLDCKKRKRSTHNCESFEINECKNLYILYNELNNFKYKIGRSTAFIFHEPATNHYREIFAADFRDRVVQHLVVNRIIKIFEYEWTDYSFSCRKDKGTLYGVKCLYNDIKEASKNYTKDCYVSNFDIYSFFASLDKDLLYDYIKQIIYDNDNLLTVYNKEYHSRKDTLYTIYLIKLILYNDPRKNCIFKQPKSFWKNIPPHKSAFHAIDKHYLAVGNVTSQLFANIFVARIINILRYEYGIRCGIYVDDLYSINMTLEEFELVKEILNRELTNRHLKLQQQKTHIQPYQNGVKFIGRVIKKDRIYILNKTKGKFIKRLKYFANEYEQGKLTIKDLEYIVACINSYLGMMIHCNSYNLRKKILNDIKLMPFGKYLYVNEKLTKVMIYQDYIEIHKRKHKYYNQVKHKSDAT